MTHRTRQYGAFVPPLKGGVKVEACLQLTVENPTADFWVRASATEPVILRILPWVVAAFTNASCLVGTSLGDNTYLAAGDVDETTPGAATEKKFRLTADTHIYATISETEYATGTLTFSDVAIADETTVIGDVTYTWKASPSAANEVKVGASAAACVTNLVAAVNADISQAGVLYGTGTVANPKASAVDGAGDTVDLTAKVKNDNTIATTETLTNGSFGAATLTGATTSTGQIDLYLEA